VVKSWLAHAATGFRHRSLALIAKKVKCQKQSLSSFAQINPAGGSKTEFCGSVGGVIFASILPRKRKYKRQAWCLPLTSK
jgi:hypothetical protein